MTNAVDGQHIRPITTALVNGSPYGAAELTTVHCPVCGFGYTHEKKPYVVEGQDDYQAGWGGRGNLTVFGFSCENGHHFDLCFGYHKGNVSAYVRSWHCLPAVTPAPN
jgi:hypothetical protein